MFLFLANLAKSLQTRKCENGCKRVLTNLPSFELGKTKNGEVMIYFYVLMRETDSSTWQKKFFTKENSMKLFILKIIIFCSSNGK